MVAAAAILWGVLIVFVRKLNAAGFEAMDIMGIRVYGSAFFLCLGIINVHLSHMGYITVRCLLSGEAKRNETFVPAAGIDGLRSG